MRKLRRYKIELTLTTTATDFTQWLKGLLRVEVPDMVKFNYPTRVNAKVTNIKITENKQNGKDTRSNT